MNVNLWGTSSTLTAFPSTIFGLYLSLSAALEDAELKIEHGLSCASGSFGTHIWRIVGQQK